jgi:hypothetical protein
MRIDDQLLTWQQERRLARSDTSPRGARGCRRRGVRRATRGRLALLRAARSAGQGLCRAGDKLAQFSDALRRRSAARTSRVRAPPRAAPRTAPETILMILHGAMPHEAHGPDCHRPSAREGRAGLLTAQMTSGPANLGPPPGRVMRQRESHDRPLAAGRRVAREGEPRVPPRRAHDWSSRCMTRRRTPTAQPPGIPLTRRTPRHGWTTAPQHGPRE